MMNAIRIGFRTDDTETYAAAVNATDKVLQLLPEQSAFRSSLDDDYQGLFEIEIDTMTYARVNEITEVLFSFLPFIVDNVALA